MSPDSVVCARSRFAIEDPWSIPPAARPVPLVRATDGAPPRLQTSVAAHYDDHFVTFVFSGHDDHVVATLTGHDDPLYEEDVVEVFLSPALQSEYFEVEVSPLGTIFDARVVSPHGHRSTMQVEVQWDSGAVAAARRVTAGGSMSFDVVLRIPFRALGRGTPLPGERWRANFFRIDRHPRHGDEYSAWRPPLRTPADFHVPAAFGVLEFAS